MPKKPDRLIRKQSKELKKYIYNKYRKPLVEKYGEDALIEGPTFSRFRNMIKKMHRLVLDNNTIS